MRNACEIENYYGWDSIKIKEKIKGPLNIFDGYEKNSRKFPT